MFARNWKILLHQKTKKLVSLAMMKLRMNLFELQKTKTADDCFVMNWKIVFARLTMNFVEWLNLMARRLQFPMTIAPQLL